MQIVFSGRKKNAPEPKGEVRGKKVLFDIRHPLREEKRGMTNHP
jgi:hypothetical protein